MRDTLQKQCDLFIQNRDSIKSAFGWEGAYIYPLCANIASSKGKQADVEKMKICLGLLKRKTTLFSNFRGASKMATVTTLSLSVNPEKMLDQILDVYNDLKAVFLQSEYLAIAAVVIAELAELDQYNQIAQRTRSIYNRMKDAHPFITFAEDSSFAVLLALSDLDETFLEQEIERCYVILKSSFFSSNAVQSLSHILALSEESAEQKCKKVLDIYNFLKSQGYKYGTNYELSTLGAFALLDIDIYVLAKDIMMVDDFLKTQKGFGTFGVGAKQRLMYAGMLATNDYMPDAETIQIAALKGVVSLVIAQQATMIAAMAASTAMLNA